MGQHKKRPGLLGIRLDYSQGNTTRYYYVVREGGISLQEIGDYLYNNPSLAGYLAWLNDPNTYWPADKKMPGGMIIDFDFPPQVKITEEAADDMRHDFSTGYYLDRKPFNLSGKSQGIQTLDGVIVPLVPEQIRDLKEKIKSTRELKDFLIAHEQNQKLLDFSRVEGRVGLHAILVNEVAIPLSNLIDSVRAFFEGLFSGLSERLSEKIVDQLRHKLDIGIADLILFPAAFSAGVSFGIAKFAWDAIKGLVEILSDIPSFTKQILEFIKLMFAPEGKDIAYAMGTNVGQDYASRIQDMASSRATIFYFKLGELVGPLLLSTLLSIVVPELKLPEVLASLASKIKTAGRKSQRLEKLFKELEEYAKRRRSKRRRDDPQKPPHGDRSTKDKGKDNPGTKDKGKDNPGTKDKGKDNPGTESKGLGETLRTPSPSIVKNNIAREKDGLTALANEIKGLGQGKGATVEIALATTKDGKQILVAGINSGSKGLNEAQKKQLEKWGVNIAPDILKGMEGAPHAEENIAAYLDSIGARGKRWSKAVVGELKPSGSSYVCYVCEAIIKRVGGQVEEGLR
jgi:hypothetical protein